MACQGEEKDLAALSSGNYLALCPFHADEKLGSFVITPDKQMWYCFTENIGWSGIHFEMMYFELDFKDAVFHLARRCSLITEEEYKRQSGKKMDEKMVKTIEKSMEKPVSKSWIDNIRECAYMRGKIDGLEFAIRCNGVSGNEVSKALLRGAGNGV